MTNYDALVEEIDAAYRRLSAAAEDLAGADRQLAEHVRRIRLTITSMVTVTSPASHRHRKNALGKRIFC
ncbi:MAG: hypothetical protein K0S15_2392 [Solirubrobacterales bacterium]|jgi:hypothetical protein|nr:hypothetical protein [Solirubrobacterales bacterium]